MGREREREMGVQRRQRRIGATEREIGERNLRVVKRESERGSEKPKSHREGHVAKCIGARHVAGATAK